MSGRQKASDESRKSIFYDLYQAGHVLIKIAVLVVLAAVLIYGVRAAYGFGYRVFTSGTVDEAPGKDIRVTITLDMSDRDISVYLRNQGLVTNSWIFFIQSKIYGYELLPGVYTLNTSQTVAEMLAILSTPPAEEEARLPGFPGAASAA